MTVNLPSTPAPPSLYPKLIPHLISQLSHTTPSSTTLPTLKLTLHIQASIRLSPSSPVPQAGSTIPLKHLLDLSTSHPGLIKVPLLLDAIIAYPLHLTMINEILTNAFEVNGDLVEVFRIDIIPSLINRLNSPQVHVEDIATSVYILLAVIRAHDELLALVLEDSENLLKSLSKAYSALGGDIGVAKVKSDILMICKELLDSVPAGHDTVEETMIGFMGDISSLNEGGVEVMGKGSRLRDDWEAVFERDESLGKDVKEVLIRERDQQAREDKRVQHLLQLFPTLPPHLLLSALSHHTISSLPEGSRATPSEQASPIVEIIFNKGEGLPDDLQELKIAIQGLSDEIVPSSDIVNAYGHVNSEKKRVERRNIFDDELDMSRLKLKDDDSSLPTLSNTIPDTLRESIMRLVENQAVEEEERRRALRDANLLDDEDDLEEGDDGVVSKIRVAGGDDEEDEISEEDGISREPSGTTTPSSGSAPSDRQRLDILRTAYISNPKVFERDGVTRRSNERKKLREITGWDDGQIEGWRIMLERDPHKDDILSAHAERMTRTRAHSPPRQNANEGSSRGGHSSRGGGRGGNRGGGRGGQGGGSRGGRGGGKSSRGHSNAARTRGHDKKMSKMGAI
uniref:CUE domain-containing protein n=1 Tax=Kwoniella bestiolae CBS 10118 TaxID=1296100 RepID=A0A1B9G6C0_9TREE|nr:hypothetical protein I302_04273 [Kwoniella bestiolae CBS 10118]OCF26587.1 hypothetical protein I302_04273 [Kwoniella bestiolae CBS 10118]